MMVPDYFEPLTAYRAWLVRANGLLCGRHQSAPWVPREAHHAACRTGAAVHISDKGQWLPAPVADCSCGVYAYTTMAAAKAECESLQWGTAIEVAYGTVKLWGRILEHEGGYRAEYAYPGALVSEDAELAGKIAQLYGIDVKHEPKVEPEPETVEDDWKFLPLTPVALRNIQHATLSFWCNALVPQVQAAQRMPSRIWWTPLADPFNSAEAWPSLIWTPPDTSEIDTPASDLQREQRHVNLWKAIARGKA